jgi:flagellar basal-body rod protein FlgC
MVSFGRRLDRELDANVVQLGRVRPDQSPFRTKYDPGNPAANERGEVKLPNVNSLVETVDMREAQRSYEANLNLITATRRMISRTIEILRA